MPAAAPTPVRKEFGSCQNTGMAAYTPIAQTVMQVITSRGELMYNAAAIATAPTKTAIATCPARSPVRSECRAHRTIATDATAYGTAVISPISTRENATWNCF
jgi:hypothetical protein